MILYSRWCALTIATRNKLAEAFGIIKKGATLVDSNIIKHDGYVIEDIESAMTVKAMQDFLRVGNTDTEQLWQMTIDRIEDREVEGALPVTPIAPSITVLPPDEVKQFKKEYKARTAKPTVKKKVITIKATVKTKKKK